MNNKLTYKFSQEDIKDYQLNSVAMDKLKNELAKEIAKEVDKEIFKKLLGPNWEIALEFSMLAEREV